MQHSNFALPKAAPRVFELCANKFATAVSVVTSSIITILDHNHNNHTATCYTFLFCLDMAKQVTPKARPKPARSSSVT